MASKKPTLKSRVDELDEWADRVENILLPERDQSFLDREVIPRVANLIAGQNLTDEKVADLELEQSQTTENMVTMQDQFERMIAVAQNLKKETASLTWR